MDAFIQIITALNSLTPLAVIGGLSYIIYLLIRSRREGRASHAELTTNHLHELPAIAESLRRIESQLASFAAGTFGQLADLRESVAHIKAKLNGR